MSHRLEVILRDTTHDDAMEAAKLIAKSGLPVERIQVWRHTQVAAWEKDGQIVVAGQAVEQDVGMAAGG